MWIVPGSHVIVVVSLFAGATTAEIGATVPPPMPHTAGTALKRDR
jgi:hypothetical protein